MRQQYIYSDFNGDLFKQSDGDVELNIDIDSIRNSIRNIITTMRGSRRMLPDFGSNYYQLLFDPMDEITARRLGYEFMHAINIWEPRVEIEGININTNYDYNQYEVTVDFLIKGFSNKDNIYNIKTILKRG